MFGSALKLLSLPSPAVYAVEHWDTVAAEAPTIGAEHFAEVERGLDRRRKYKLDENQMRFADERGVLLIFTARVDDVLAGYITWQISLDVESEGLPIAIQGAWFVRPGYFGVGLGVFDRSVVELKRRGVQCIFPHHRLQGRGARLGEFFKRRGAIEIKHEYMLWIGG